MDWDLEINQNKTIITLPTSLTFLFLGLWSNFKSLSTLLSYRTFSTRVSLNLTSVDRYQAQSLYQHLRISCLTAFDLKDTHTHIRSVLFILTLTFSSPSSLLSPSTTSGRPSSSSSSTRFSYTLFCLILQEKENQSSSSSRVPLIGTFSSKKSRYQNLKQNQESRIPIFNDLLVGGQLIYYIYYARDASILKSSIS